MNLPKSVVYQGPYAIEADGRPGRIVAMRDALLLRQNPIQVRGRGEVPFE